jgi:hypothetical protein
MLELHSYSPAVSQLCYLQPKVPISNLMTKREFISMKPVQDLYLNRQSILGLGTSRPVTVLPLNGST